MRRQHRGRKERFIFMNEESLNPAGDGTPAQGGFVPQGSDVANGDVANGEVAYGGVPNAPAQMAASDETPAETTGVNPFTALDSTGSFQPIAYPTGSQQVTKQPAVQTASQPVAAFDRVDDMHAMSAVSHTVASDMPDDAPTAVYDPLQETAPQAAPSIGAASGHSYSASMDSAAPTQAFTTAAFETPTQSEPAPSAPSFAASASSAFDTAVPVSFATPVESANTADAGESNAAAPAAKRHHRVWPWIVLAVIVVLGAAAAMCVQHYQSRALPGVTLWGRSVAGETQQQIADDVTKLVNDTTVTVTYNGNSEQATLADLGYTVDANSIAQQAFDAKRSANIIQRYLPGTTENVAPAIGDANDADPTQLGNDFGVASTAGTDATVALNADRTQYETTPASAGTGLSVTNVAQELLDAITDPTKTIDAVELQVSDVQPAITDDIATSAATTLNNLIANLIKITGNGGDIAALGVDAIDASYSLDASETTPDGDQRSGYVLFDAAKLQNYYDTSIKTTYQATEEDRDVVVNNDGEVIKTNTEGHPGVTVADGGDTSVGTDAAKAMAAGSGTVQIDATVTPMQTKQTKRHTVVDLSDRLLYAYENDQVVQTFHVVIGRGNNSDGSCGGDFCTPEGDYKIFQRVENQTMTGNVVRSDGTVEKWSVPNVGWTNYFTHDGCAIHRISGSQQLTDADLATSTRWTHGCVGLGWDVAEWYYNWADYNETVHIQQ